ncbi:hypothetical protein [Methylovulum psychrotolerans]|uniref:Uncharacterized protein n=1 Tax=Methylovulum psychrotolerans TaxID=1704499 RepID=A0A2S5CJG3_9GAMM|nr:hypothetical protein [Methylovulum psychrotolerans]POZ50887.1 hypothetical protein AADEFJLK_03359 [Methylovulum psychrotolerans]
MLLKKINTSSSTTGLSVALVIMIASTSVAVADPVTFFDLVGDLKPATASKNMLIVKSLQSPGTVEACTVDYNLSGSPTIASMNGTLGSTSTTFSNTFWTTWNAPKWKLAEWQSVFSFCDTNSISLLSGQSLNLKRPGEESVTSTNAKSLWFNQDSVTIGLRSVSQYKALYGLNLTGGAFYRDGTIKDWPALLLSTPFHNDSHRAPLGTYSSIQFGFTGRLLAASINTSNVTGTPPLGAQTNYDSNKHRSQFRMFIPIGWEDLSHTVSGCYNSDGSPVAYSSSLPKECAFNGKYLHYGIQLYNDVDNYKAESLALDIGTNLWMYNQNLSVLFPSLGASNPFKVANPSTSTTLTTDILVEAKRTIKMLETKQNTNNAGKADSQKVFYIPPRLTNETDDQYFQHFSLSSVNIGFESPGLSQLQFEISDFKLIGTPN